MLFEFECGCVGFGKTVEDDCEVSMLVYACDSDDGNYGFLKRDMTGKTFEPLTFEKEKKVFSRISSLIKFGYDLIAAQALLRPRNIGRFD